MRGLKFTAVIFLIFSTEILFAQIGRTRKIKWADSDAPLSTVYLHLSGQYGRVLTHSENELMNGIGGTMSFLLPIDFVYNRYNRYRNYYTIGIKGFNSPHIGKPYLSSMNIKGDHEVDDSFNYFQILGGYRFCERIRYDGTYFEPRIGYILWDFHDNDFGNQAVVISPAFGYVFRNYDFAGFCDFGISQRHNNTGERIFFTLGISVGYNFGLYKVNSCNCNPGAWQ